MWSSEPRRCSSKRCEGLSAVAKTAVVCGEWERKAAAATESGRRPASEQNAHARTCTQAGLGWTDGGRLGRGQREFHRRGQWRGDGAMGNGLLARTAGRGSAGEEMRRATLCGRMGGCGGGWGSSAAERAGGVLCSARLGELFWGTRTLIPSGAAPAHGETQPSWAGGHWLRSR